jgi:hypothetical protein
MKLPVGWRIEKDQSCGWVSLYDDKGTLMAIGPEEMLFRTNISCVWVSEQARKEFEAKGQLLD